MKPRPDGTTADGLEGEIRARLPLSTVTSVPGIRLHQAGPRSRLWQIESSFGSPYFAYPWSGGLALARHFLEHRDIVAGRRVFDLGTGSGIVAIAAARAGAGRVLAADIDPRSAAAVRLNAKANDVAVSIRIGDATAGPVPDVDLLAVGDLFYESGLAGRVLAFLDRCLEAGIEVVIGDPGRAFLPLQRLRLIASYGVTGFGDSRQAPFATSSVFALQRKK